MKIRAALTGVILVGASMLPAPTLLSTVYAQTNGETRCGADGYVERYSKFMDSWQSTYSHCSGSGGGSSSSRNNNGSGGGGGEPQDGDTKCGADGKVYHYHAYSHQWTGGIADCK